MGVCRTNRQITIQRDRVGERSLTHIQRIQKGAEMADKYHITAKEGDRRIFKPRLQGHDWTDHEYYMMPCTVIQSSAVYDVHLIHIDGLGDNATWWACGDELIKAK